MNIPVSKPTAWKFLTGLAGVVMAIASQPTITVREALAMLGAFLAGVGGLTLKAKS